MMTSQNAINAKWPWFVGLGLALLFMGFFAIGNLLTATKVTIFYVGALMTIGGLIQVLHSFQIKSWSGFALVLSSGLLYGAGGVIAFQNPFLAAATMTLFFACFLMAAGFVRIWSSFRLSKGLGGGWTFTSGLITLFAGSVFLWNWPTNSLWLLGLMLAVDLGFQRISALALGFKLKAQKHYYSEFEQAVPVGI